MGENIQLIIIILIIAGAAAFAGLRIVKALRRGRPSCCTGNGKDPVKKTKAP
jgi:hypothetical protein